MTYTVTDITELIHYHLVLGAPNVEQADENLRNLRNKVDAMSTRAMVHLIEWLQCDECGAMVDTDLIDPDGAGYDEDGDFLCSECRWRYEED